MKKTIPIGVVDYEELQTNEYYVVDKTLMIEEFLTRKSKVTLITRPRRFGKTLNMSMMSEFFDNTKDSKKLFQDTNIAKTIYMKDLNKYPVIYLSFASAKGSITNMTSVIKRQITQAYQKYANVFENMDAFDLSFYHTIQKNLNDSENSSLQGCENTILFLLEKIEQFYHTKTMVFIDEYDTPFIEAHVQGYYNDIKEFLSMLLHSTLKDNTHLQYAMLTGIQRVAKENIFSDLNNLDVYTVKNKDYAQYFGFTNQETKTLLEYYEIPYNDDVKDMYDGYNMGGIDIYNPWSIINYAKRQELISYWINTSSNTMIKAAMENSEPAFHSGYEALITQGYVDTLAQLDTSYYEQISTNNLWGLLINSGYLTIESVNDLENDDYRLRIPNREVTKEFKVLTAHYLHVEPTELSSLYSGIKNQDFERFIHAYRNLLLTNPSYHDLKDENSYHMFMLGICLYIKADYEIYSNREIGIGRCDIILKAKSQDLPSYVIEFKYTKDKKQLERLATQAIEQITTNNYDCELNGKIIYIGLAHCGKEVIMKWANKS